MPGRRLIWVSWPSTQTCPSLCSQSAILVLMVRTGHAVSGVLLTRVLLARGGHTIVEHRQERCPRTVGPLIRRKVLQFAQADRLQLRAELRQGEVVVVEQFDDFRDVVGRCRRDRLHIVGVDVGRRAVQGEPSGSGSRYRTLAGVIGVATWNQCGRGRRCEIVVFVEGRPLRLFFVVPQQRVENIVSFDRHLGDLLLETHQSLESLTHGGHRKCDRGGRQFSSLFQHRYNNPGGDPCGIRWSDHPITVPHATGGDHQEGRIARTLNIMSSAEISPGGKTVLLAEPRGYCAGVDRAVEAVEKALEKHGAPVYVRKEIVHNRHVVETLADRGAVFVDETDEVPEGALVVFSAHGVSPAVHESAAERNLRTIDATCPLVTKVHQEAKRFARDDYDILLIGHEGHEEVEGTAGEAPQHVQLVDGPDSVDAVTVRDESKIVWLSQTTLSVDETMQTVSRLREKFPLLNDPPSDDICYATQNRQVAVKAMAPKCDLVIVVGSRNSSNSVRLVEVALQAGARTSYLVDYARDVDLTWLEGVETVGVTSGASVPEVLVRGVLDLLGEHGYNNIEKVTTAEETLTFALPRELRPARAK